MIPNLVNNWMTVTFADVTDGIFRGKSPKYIENSSLPVINQRAIRWFGIQKEHLKYIHPDQIEQWSPAYYIREGDILLNSTGTGTMGRACLVSSMDVEPPKVVDSHVTIIRPNREVVDPRYLFSWIRSREVQDTIASLATGATNQIELNRTTIATISIPLAPLNEQKRIADKLDALLVCVDACRTRLERVPQFIDRFRQAVLASATSGQLTADWRLKQKSVSLDDEGEIGFDFADANQFDDYRFPASWKPVRLGEIAEIAGGVTKDTKKQDLTDEEIPYLRVANVQRGFLDLSEVKTIRVPQKRIEELLLIPGDILFNEGGDLDKLGRGWVWAGEIERCTFQNHVFRARLHDKSFEPKFFSMYGNSRGFDYFTAFGKQTTNLASINKTILARLPVAVPPAEEQVEIVRRVEVLFAYADQLGVHYQSAYSQVEALTPTLLDKAFRGELVPQDPNDEPASKLLERIRTVRASQVEDIKQKPRKPVKKLEAKFKGEEFMLTKMDIQPTHLSAILKARGPLTAEALWSASQLEIDDFYDQLKAEEAQRLLKEIRNEATNVSRLLEAV